MPTAHRLPSGSWRVQFYINGSRQSVTAETKKAAELAAADHIRRGSFSPVTGTTGQAIRRYLDDKSSVLSPSTLYSYEKILKNNLAPIVPIRLSSLNNADVQRLINDLAATHSAKTVRNIYGLITAALRYTRPDLDLHVQLPPPRKSALTIPDNADISPLIAACSHNHQLQTAVILASTCGLRLSEICALTWADIDLKAAAITISKATVRGKDNAYHLKAPKSYAGYRTIQIPAPTVRYLQQLPHDHDQLITCSSKAISDAFRNVRARLGFTFRFHDLRHYYASVLLALGVPDKYAMQRMGHATSYTLQHVYQHLMDDKQKDIDLSVNAHFKEVF